MLISLKAGKVHFKNFVYIFRGDFKVSAWYLHLVQCS